MIKHEFFTTFISLCHQIHLNKQKNWQSWMSTSNSHSHFVILWDEINKRRKQTKKPGLCVQHVSSRKTLYEWPVQNETKGSKLIMISPLDRSNSTKERPVQLFERRQWRQPRTDLEILHHRMSHSKKQMRKQGNQKEATNKDKLSEIKRVITIVRHFQWMDVERKMKRVTLCFFSVLLRRKENKVSGFCGWA